MRIDGASALLVTAGAGMGVDSGLPDFRGAEGFWRAYPPFRALGLRFEDLANPRWFEDDPALAWGFYGHRLTLYRATVPHAGFGVLHRLSQRIPTFVFTSNVDGQFQASGFADVEVYECHGSIHTLQCSRLCGQGFWSARDLSIRVDPASFRADTAALPQCPTCSAIARPAILMFGDTFWDDTPFLTAEQALKTFLTGHPSALVIECGAGTSVPTVRRFSEQVAACGGGLIRINVRESGGPPGTLSLPMTAEEALLSLESVYQR